MACVESHGKDWLRYYAADVRETNPRLLQALAARDVGVLTLSEVPRSLEEVYLRVVQEA
jgi:ABC-2 type transport system ATP-binding protein